MNFVNIRYFLAAAKELNFTRAAEKLCISQQSLSNHIQRMEQQFNTELFERSPKLKLTYAGACLVKLGTQIVDLERKLLTQLDDISNQRRGRLTIGISHTRGRILMPQILPIYSKQYPYVELILASGLAEELEVQLLHGEIDLIIGPSKFYSENLIKINLLTDPLCAVVPKQISTLLFPSSDADMVKYYQNGIDFSLFYDQPFLMMPHGSNVRNLVDRYFQNKNKKPHIALESPDIDTLIALCLSGMGIVFAFESVASKRIKDANCSGQSIASIFPIHDEHMKSEIIIAYPKEYYVSRAAQDFIALASQIFSNQTPFN